MNNRFQCAVFPSYNSFVDQNKVFHFLAPTLKLTYMPKLVSTGIISVVQYGIYFSVLVGVNAR